MSDWPTSTQYQEALQFPESAFRDPVLQQGDPKTNALGLPQPISGAFAVVFPINSRDNKWAVKCFLNDIKGQKKRYTRIQGFLGERDLPYFVPFEYQEKGILVDGARYPILKMEWVDGVPLNRFVREHRSSEDILRELRSQWVELISDLQQHDVAHGDLQHGNVLVSKHENELSLHLVDYDTMYVPGVRNTSTPEIGHRNYQHPDRQKDNVGTHIDRFPALVILAALEATIYRPELWETFDTDENMLFVREDFYEPNASPLLNEMTRSGQLGQRARQLTSSCFMEPEGLPTLEDFLSGEEVAIPSGRSSVERSTKQRALFEQWAPHTVIIITLTSAMLIQAGHWPGAWGIFAVGMMLILWGGYFHYNRLPPVRRRKHLSDEEAYHHKVIETLEREKASVEEQREQILGTAAERRQERLTELQEQALYDHLKYHFIQEAREVEGISHKVIVRLKSAGVRNAYEASEDELAQIVQMRNKTKTRILMWRNALVRSYEDDIPDELSPSEKRRINRYIQHRTEDLDARISRITEKINQNQQALNEIAERKASLLEVSRWDYVQYLIRRKELPEM